MKILAVLAIAFKFVVAYNLDSVIDEVALISGVDKQVYLSIVKIESNGKQNIIAFNGSDNFYNYLKGLKEIDSSLEIKKYSPNRIVIYSPNNSSSIVAIAKELYLLQKSFDLGIAQINSQNFSYEEIPLMLDIKYNIIKANNILADCRARFHLSIPSSIECYNKGYINHQGYSYYKKFMQSYLGVEK